MSHDDETVVRRRLRRLTAQPLFGAASGGAPPGDAASIVGTPDVPSPAPSGVTAAPPGLSEASDLRDASDLSAAFDLPAGAAPGMSTVTGRSAGSGASEAPGLSTASALSVAPVRPAEPGLEGGASAGGPGGLPGPGAFDPGRRGIRALAAVAVVVVLGAGFWAWRSRPRAEPVRPAVSTAVPVVEGVADGVAEPDRSAAGELVVAVAGKVRRPGLVRLPVGARLADAVEAAGGALPGVDVALLNPARKLSDGELIVVGVTPPPAAGQPVGGSGEGPAAGGVPGPGGRVNLNTATLAQLDALPGVGPVLAQRILTHREQHGGFRSVGDLRQVEGIGDARYEQLKDLVTV